MFNHKNINKGTLRITFGGVLTILITLAIMVFSAGITNDIVNWSKTFFYITLYFILALLSGSFPMISEIMTNILSIKNENDLANTEKILVIKDQLEIYNDYFGKIFTEVRTGDKHNTIFQAKEYIKTTSYRVMKGSITPLQTLWIMGYISYQILLQSNFLNIALPYNIIITVGFLIILQLTSGSIQGLGKLIGDLYITVRKDIGDDNEKFILAKIIHTIRILCLGYNRISKKIERYTGMCVSDYIINPQPINRNGV